MNNRNTSQLPCSLFSAIGVGPAGAAIFSARGLKYCVHPAADSSVEVPCSESGEQFVFDDALRDDVWQHSLEPVADLNARYAIARENEKNNTIIVFALPDTPSLGGALRKIFQGISVGNSWEGGDEHLIRGFPFERLQTLVQCRDELRRENTRCIDHISGRFRREWISAEKQAPSDDENRQKQKPLAERMIVHP